MRGSVSTTRAGLGWPTRSRALALTALVAEKRAGLRLAMAKMSMHQVRQNGQNHDFIGFLCSARRLFPIFEAGGVLSTVRNVLPAHEGLTFAPDCRLPVQRLYFNGLAIAVGWAELKEPGWVADVVELEPEKILLVLCCGDFLLAHCAD